MTNKLPDIVVDFSKYVNLDSKNQISFMYSNNYVDGATSWLQVITIQNWLAEHNITYVVTFFNTSCLDMTIDCDEARTLIKMAFPLYEPLVMGW
jgi:hypothetical protein